MSPGAAKGKGGHRITDQTETPLAPYLLLCSETQAKLLICFILAVSQAPGGGPPGRGLAGHTPGQTE